MTKKNCRAATHREPIKREASERVRFGQQSYEWIRNWTTANEYHYKRSRQLLRRCVPRPQVDAFQSTFTTGFIERFSEIKCSSQRCALALHNTRVPSVIVRLMCRLRRVETESRLLRTYSNLALTTVEVFTGMLGWKQKQRQKNVHRSWLQFRGKLRCGHKFVGILPDA